MSQNALWGEEFHEINTDTLRLTVVDFGETFIAGYLFVFVNEFHIEQDRIVLLTDSAFYRVKFKTWKNLKECIEPKDLK